MDLGTTKKKIIDRKYKSLQQAAEDVRLVWSNCMTYNADGSDFFVLAQGLAKKWEDKYQKLLTDLGVEEGAGTGAIPNGAPNSSSGSGAPPMADTTNASNSNNTNNNNHPNNNKISVDDKRAFARSLYKITKEDLGKLIVEVDNKCPTALTKNSGEDECELNVDKLTPVLFAELKAFVNGCKNNSSNTMGSSNNSNTQTATSSGLSKKKSSSSAVKRQKT
jgi:hypothetical protein